MSDGRPADLKCALHCFLDQVIRAARASGIAPEDIYRSVSAEALVLAAELHDGSEASFHSMATRALALARTGSIEQ